MRHFSDKTLDPEAQDGSVAFDPLFDSPPETTGVFSELMQEESIFVEFVQLEEETPATPAPDSVEKVASAVPVEGLKEHTEALPLLEDLPSESVAPLERPESPGPTEEPVAVIPAPDLLAEKGLADVTLLRHDLPPLEASVQTPEAEQGTVEALAQAEDGVSDASPEDVDWREAFGSGETVAWRESDGPRSAKPPVEVVDAAASPEDEEREPSRFGALLRRMRPAAPSRPLQINELALAAEEHLRAAARPSLERLFLPSRIVFGISQADFDNLRPFDEYIENEILKVYVRLLGEPDFAALWSRPQIEIYKVPHFKEGNSPELQSGFHVSRLRASWRPGRRSVLAEPMEVKPVELQPQVEEEAAPEEPAEPEAVEVTAKAVIPPEVFAGPDAGGAAATAAALGLYEILAMPGQAQGTARQALLRLCLAPTLPLQLLQRRAETGTALRLDDDEQPVTLEGSAVADVLPELRFEALPPIVELPDLGAPAAAAMAEPPLFLFRAPGQTPLCWAPGGLLVIGRDPRRANWIPEGAPRNLSGRHLAFAAVADDDGCHTLFALDLGSTNGLYYEGSRIEPLRPVAVKVPGRCSVGREGSLDLEITPLALPEPIEAARSRNDGPGTRDELGRLPLR